MGAVQSNEDFVRAQLAARGTDALVLGQVLEVQPPREYRVDLRHLGTVYVLDAEHAGCVARAGLVAFANFYCEFRAGERSVDSDAKFQAYCTLRLWNDLARAGGVDAFVAWVTRLALCNDEAVAAARGAPTPHHRTAPASAASSPRGGAGGASITTMSSPRSSPRSRSSSPGGSPGGGGSRHGGHGHGGHGHRGMASRAGHAGHAGAGTGAGAGADAPCVSWDTVRDLHKLFAVRQGLGLDLQSFIDLLQRAGPARGDAPAESCKGDSAVPLKAVADFAREFALGFVQFLSDLGFTPNMPLDR